MYCFHNEKNNGARIFKNPNSANELKQNKTIKRPYQNPGLHPMAKSNSEGACIKDCGFCYLCSH